MQELAGRLTALDPEASESLKVISYFDALVANGAGAESLVRAGAILAGTAAGAHLGTRTLRVDGAGRRTEGALDGDWRTAAAPGGPVVWIERSGPALANDAMILERMSLALEIVESRRGGAGGALEVALDPEHPVEERVAAAGRLRLDAGGPLHVWALPASARPGGVTAVIATPEGLVRAAIAPAETAPTAPAGVAAASGPAMLADAWRDARLALRLTDTRHPVVVADDLGALILVARAFDPAAPPHPDVAALRSLDERSREVLDALVAAESVRAAASALSMHHSSLQARHDSWVRRLGYDPRSASGRARYEAARMLVLLSR